jgi:hypothetical protein
VYVLVSGYSFCDKGINSEIRRFIELDDNKRVMVIDPNPEELKNNSRGMIFFNWNDWEIKDKLKVFGSNFEDFKWDYKLFQL